VSHEELNLPAATSTSFRNIEDFLKECDAPDGNVQVVPPEMLDAAAAACEKLESQQQHPPGLPEEGNDDEKK
jgi:uncharacterized OsmC-like protein